MKKLTLNVEALRVESFETQEERDPGGVRARSETDQHRVCTYSDCAACSVSCDGDAGCTQAATGVCCGGVSDSTCMAGTCPGSYPCICGDSVAPC